ncbi:MAG: hypothetical protein RJA34_2571, partial [Pseudomonadota bacterium]
MRPERARQPARHTAAHNPLEMKTALYELLGLDDHEVIGVSERSGHVQISAHIGIWVGMLFALFNLASPEFRALGWTELAGVIFLLIPAYALSRHPTL